MHLACMPQPRSEHSMMEWILMASLRTINPAMTILPPQHHRPLCLHTTRPADSVFRLHPSSCSWKLVVGYESERHWQLAYAPADLTMKKRNWTDVGPTQLHPSQYTSLSHVRCLSTGQLRSLEIIQMGLTDFSLLENRNPLFSKTIVLPSPSTEKHELEESRLLCSELLVI
jgi:hypothetical protein